MTTSNTSHSVSRRATLAGLGAGGLGLGLALAAPGASTSAQVDASDLAGHPLAGVWQAMVNPPSPDAPQFPAPSVFAPDGSVLLIWPPVQAGQSGVEFVSNYVGAWEAHDERTGHFTAVQVIADANGVVTGSVTVDGHPMVAEDGQTFIDDGSLNTVTIRDAAGAVVLVVPDAAAGRPVTATRMGDGRSGFPNGDPEAATPTS